MRLRIRLACAFVVAGAAGIFWSVGASAASVADDTLVPYTITDNAIAASLTGKPGDPVEGKKVVVDRKLGNCLGCHSMPIVGEADMGNVGPDLHGVGNRLTASQIRLRIVNTLALDPTTIMPSYYRVTGLEQVGKKFVGKPILTAEQVENVVAYLATFK